MSYIRSPSVLEWFYDISNVYAYNSGHRVNAYGLSHANNPTIIELIATFIERESGDKIFSDRMVRILAHKLHCEDKLRPNRLTYEEWNKESNILHDALTFGDRASASIEPIRDGIQSGLSDEEILEHMSTERKHVESIIVAKQRYQDGRSTQ
jgi:hypothetical protein